MIGEIKKFLSDKSITVPDKWIPACLDFIKTEYGSNIGNAGWMKNKVLEQWLHADITDLASCCLPFGILQQKLATITGQFPLQVNSVRDVGLPAYCQLQKLHKSNVQNESVSADVSHKAAWEPKPSRMLMLELTDGTSIVQGMEYSFIPCLSLGLQPGSKILVKGVIETRRGVLFLTKENVSLLGGEVESLLILNAQENVLNKALGLDITDTPAVLPDSCLQLEPSQIASSTVPSQYYPTQSSQYTQKLNSVHTTHSNWPKTSSNVSASSSRGNNITLCIKSPPKVPATEGFDDLDDFFDDETELALLEVERKMTSVSENNYSQPTNASGNNSSTWSNFSETKSHAKKPFQQKYSNNLDLSKSRNAQLLNKIPNYVNNVSSGPGNFPKCNVSSYTEKVHNFNDSLELDDDDILLAAEMAVSSQLKADSSTVNNCLNNVKDQNASIVMLKKLKQSKITSFSAPFKDRFGSSSDNKSSFQSQKFNEEFISKEKNILVSHNTSTSETADIYQTVNKSIPQNSIPVHIKNEEENAFKRRRLSPNNYVDQKGVESKCKEYELKLKLQEMPLPFQYICMINMNPDQNTFYTIKGFVLTLLSKLEREQDKWCLKAKINDGTGSCDVLIHNEILCRLIGMSVHDFISKKKEAKSNPALRNSMNQMVNNCQKELITMCCILRLEVGPRLTLPVVTELIPLTNTHYQQLISRSESYLE